ncbi:hypothetical protein PM082_019282 [Marasmius tenuissimus]|nr:hypothetical protein PM082_019282 [Marasmius tenuissimus]
MLSNEVSQPLIWQRAEPVTREGIQSENVLGPLWFFNTLQILGFALNTIVVLTVAINNKQIRRTAVWYMFMVGWVLWCTAHALLMLAGYQGSEEPPTAFCLFQAALVYAFPPGMALLTLAILAQLYAVMHATIRQRCPPENINILFVSVPLVAFSGIFVQVLVVGIRDPAMVTRDATLMYCNTKSTTPPKTSALIVGLASVMMLILESFVIVALVNHWGTIARFRQVPGNVLSGTMAFRVTIFSFMPMIALILSVVAVLSEHASAISHVAIAFLPTIAALIFGTQKDVLKPWKFGKKDGPSLLHGGPIYPAQLPTLEIATKDTMGSPNV